MSWISILLDFIPMGMAIYAILKLQTSKSNSETTIAMSAAILLLVCQSTWMHSYLNGFDMVTSIMDKLWSIFNSVCMILVIIVANRNQK